MGRQYQPNVQLRNARLLRNWTYKETARELNLLMLSRGETQAAVTLQMIYRWERGEVRPSMFYRRYFCLLYGMRPDQLGFLPKECAELARAWPEEFPAAEISTRIGKSGVPQRRMALAKEPAQPSPSGTSHQPESPLSEDELEALNLTRRNLLAAAGLLGAAAGAETAAEVAARVAEPIERAARVASGRAAADSHLIAELQAITDRFENARRWISGDLLVEPVHAHLDLVKAVLERSLLPAQREALLSTASQTASLLSTVHLFHQGDRTAARRSLIDSIEFGEATSDVNMHVLGLMRAAQVATYSGEGGTSVQLLEHARRLAERRCAPNILSWIHADLAEAHAALRQPKEVPRLLDLAAEAQQRSRPGDEISWTEPWTRSHIAGYIGAVYMRLEQPTKARTGLHEALAHADPSESKPRSIYLADLAITYAQDLEVERACELAGSALELAAPIRYGITLERVDGLLRRLTPWQDDRAVKDLDERLRAVGAAAS